MTIANVANWAPTQHDILSIASNLSLTNLSPLTSGYGLVSNGALAAPGFQLIPAGFSINTQVFTYTGSTQNYTPTSGCQSAIVICVGGGGGGGGSNAGGSGTLSASCGGNGGAVAMSIIASPTTETITIGAGGAGGAANSAGSSGTATTYSTIVEAQGGGGGVATDSHTGSKNSAAQFWAEPSVPSLSSSVGNILITGGAGGSGRGGYFGSGLLFSIGGAGGTCMFGGGAPAGWGNADTQSGAGNNALGYGGGGSGAWNCTNGANTTGGNGGNGICIILEFIT